MGANTPGNIANTFQSLVPAVRTASGNGTGISTLGFTNLLAILNVGTVTGGAQTLDVTLEEAATLNGQYTAITGAAFTQVTATPSPATAAPKVNVNLMGRSAFIRAVATITGSTPSLPSAVTFVLTPSLDTANVTAANASV